MSIRSRALLPLLALGFLAAGCSKEAQETPATPASEGAPVPTVAAPSDAAPEVAAEAHWVSTKPGGAGAVREFIELVLKARGDWAPLIERLKA